MTLKKRILTGMGALAFIGLLALNVHLVNTANVQEAGFASITLLEIEVQAQTEGGDECDDCLPEEQCVEGDCILLPSNCLVVGDAMAGNPKNLLKCMQDASGPDIFVCYTNTCEPAQVGVCNPHSCKTAPGCYTLPI